MRNRPRVLVALLLLLALTGAVLIIHRIATTLP